MCKKEGRELPKPKCFVRYSTVDPEQVAKENDERRRLRMAERKALNNSGNGIAGESTATIEGNQQKNKKRKNYKREKKRRSKNCRMVVYYLSFWNICFLSNFISLVYCCLLW